MCTASKYLSLNPDTTDYKLAAFGRTRSYLIVTITTCFKVILKWLLHFVHSVHSCLRII